MWCALAFRCISARDGTTVLSIGGLSSYAFAAVLCALDFSSSVLVMGQLFYWRTFLTRLLPAVLCAPLVLVMGQLFYWRTPLVR